MNFPRSLQSRVLSICIKREKESVQFSRRSNGCFLLVGEFLFDVFRSFHADICIVEVSRAGGGHGASGVANFQFNRIRNAGLCVARFPWIFHRRKERGIWVDLVGYLAENSWKNCTPPMKLDSRFPWRFVATEEARRVYTTSRSGSRQIYLPSQTNPTEQHLGDPRQKSEKRRKRKQKLSPGCLRDNSYCLRIAFAGAPVSSIRR